MPLILKGLNQAGEGQRDVDFTPDDKQVRTLHRHTTRVVLLGISLSCLASAASYRIDSYVMVGPQLKPSFAWCDAQDRILAVTAPSPPLSGSEDVREVSLLRWLKNKPGDAGNFKYKLGPTEGAAGSTYTGLIPAGFKATRELAGKYFIHQSSVRRPPAYRMAQVVRFNTPQGENRCRYMPNAAFMGATSKRTVIVWDEGDAVTYATRNFNGTPGVFVTGGRWTADDHGKEFHFSTEYGFVYTVYFSPSAAFIEVRKNGRKISTEPFLAYSVSTSTN